MRLCRAVRPLGALFSGMTTSPDSQTPSDLFYGWRDVTATADFVLVLDQDAGGGYDWHRLAAWYSVDRARFYWAAGSGCSCNHLGEDLSVLGDLCDGDAAALERAVKSHFVGDYHASDREAALSSLRDFRRPA